MLGHGCGPGDDEAPPLNGVLGEATAWAVTLGLTVSLDTSALEVSYRDARGLTLARTVGRSLAVETPSPPSRGSGSVGWWMAVGFGGLCSMGSSERGPSNRDDVTPPLSYRLELEAPESYRPAEDGGRSLRGVSRPLKRSSGEWIDDVDCDGLCRGSLRGDSLNVFVDQPRRCVDPASAESRSGV